MVLVVAAAVAAVVAVVLVAVAAVAAVAAVVVLMLVAAVVAVAADSVVPSLLEPQSSRLRGPMSWPRDSCLGRMRVSRPSPTQRLPHRIPEPLEVVSDWSSADSAVLCRLAEVASVLGVEPSPWARLELPEERRCKAKMAKCIVRKGKASV